jgi:hypothetical protein
MYKYAAVLSVFMISLYVIFIYTIGQDIATSLYFQTQEQLENPEDLQLGRMAKLKVDWEEFLEFPFLGNCATVVSLSKESQIFHRQWDFRNRVDLTDLGYPHWLKSFGLTGVLWLLTVYVLIFIRLWKSLITKDKVCHCLALFCSSYFAFVVMTMLTLNHFMKEEMIILFSLSFAITYRLGCIKECQDLAFQHG